MENLHVNPAILCTLIDALVVRNILSPLKNRLYYFVKPLSDNLLLYFKMFHLSPSPSSLQHVNNPSLVQVLTMA